LYLKYPLKNSFTKYRITKYFDISPINPPITIPINPKCNEKKYMDIALKDVPARTE
jgi:hypothetical protein